MSAVVYEFVDATGASLYVGVTQQILTRLSDHGAQPWWPEVAEIHTEPVPAGIDAARALEVRRIYERSPRYNAKRTTPAFKGPRVAQTPSPARQLVSLLMERDIADLLREWRSTEGLSWRRCGIRIYEATEVRVCDETLRSWHAATDTALP